ncbi:MAG TPA: radical SAM protein [Chloroflexota bacterium]|nr:radical SAM protein [Chloroflexota bacterium]
MPSISQFAKRAIAGKPALFGWLYQPYADYLFKKRRSYLAARYQELLHSDQRAEAGTAFSIGHEPTIRCNLACKMCYQGDFREDEGGVKELTLDQMIAVYDRVNVSDAKLVGSEIFMRKDIYELLDYLWKRKIPTSLMTNGTLLNEEGIQKLRKYDNIEWVGFSVDGSKEIHNAIRRRPYAFDRTVEAIGRTMPYFTVSVNSVILKENLDDLTSILRLCKKLGIPFVHYIFEEAYSQAQVQKTHQILQSEMGWGPDDYEICTNVRDDFEYSFEELVSAIDKLKREGRKLGVYPVFSPDVWSRRLSDYYFGTAAKNLHLVCAKLVSDTPTFRLDHLGNVHHCGVIRRPFGNLLEQSPEEIWNSEEYRRYRKLLMGKNLLPICTRCCKAAYL